MVARGIVQASMQAAGNKSGVATGYRHPVDRFLVGKTFDVKFSAAHVGVLFTSRFSFKGSFDLDPTHDCVRRAKSPISPLLELPLLWDLGPISVFKRGMLTPLTGVILIQF